VLQTCTRYGHRSTSCQFCAIGQSLAAKRTIAEKTPEQLAEVAEAAVELDGVKHFVMTTGTPRSSDRGALVLAQAASAVRARVELPIQAQCEPPEDFMWFSRLKTAGVDSIGIHLEAVTEEVRRRIMPGKAEVSVERYFEAFEAAVEVFGRGQVSTYILAGLGDSEEDIVKTSERLVQTGVYPFVVPFVPISGTPLENHGQPDSAFMHRLLDRVGAILNDYQLLSSDIKAGCGRCGACSSLKARERRFAEVQSA
jgi:radical SAM protein (TIGR04043 family)